MAEKTNETSAPTKTQAGGISKMEGMRRALKELGRDTKPVVLQGFLKQRFGINMTTQQISKYKGKIPKKPKAKKLAAPKPAANKTAAKKPAAPKPQAQPAKAKPGGIPLKDVLTVKDLVVRLGADHLRTLIDAFGR